MERETRKADAAETVLQAYLLGMLEFSAAQQFQRRLHYEVTGNRDTASLVLCEHPPLITVGRQGSRSHILWESQELGTRGWPIRWVNRAGGCWLHVPGQVNLYAIVPLDRFRLTVVEFVERLGLAVQKSLADFDVRSEVRDGGVWIKQRMVAGIGVAIRDWVSYYGLCFNAFPDLDPFRMVRCSPHSTEAMTSLERERHGRVRPSFLRERLVEHFHECLGTSRLTLFTDHPSLKGYQERCRVQLHEGVRG